MSFDRHPYLKHSTAMPAHKDTQHPAGQVVNQDAGQHTLAAYVRSINRAQAFDDIARELAEKAQEKKLTFDEWWAIEYNTTNLGPGEKHHLIISKKAQKKAWNYALTNGKVS